MTCTCVSGRIGNASGVRSLKAMKPAIAKVTETKIPLFDCQPNSERVSEHATNEPPARRQL